MSAKKIKKTTTKQDKTKENDKDFARQSIICALENDGWDIVAFEKPHRSEK